MRQREPVSPMVTTS